jgi:heat shock protein HslJ
MRSGRRAVALAGLLGVVAGCGSGSPAPAGPAATSGGSGGSTAPAAPVGRAAPDGPPLVGTEWVLAAVFRDGSERPPPPAAREALLRLDGRGKITGVDGCNSFGADVRVGPATLTIGRLMTTDMACVDEVPRAFEGILGGTVNWAIRDGKLWLTRPAGEGLVFAQKASIYPAGDLTPLLLGRRDGGDYRLGWSTRDGLVGVEWNWRDGPGRPWGYVGLTGDIGRPATRPEPMVGAAGRAWYVFGAIRSDATRLAYLPAGGGRAVPLRVFRLGGVDSLVAYGGFVESYRRGAVVVAYRADGSELGRSIPLPGP